MKKQLLTSTVIIALSTLSFAQNGQLPPVTFSSGSNVCDNATWQLVLNDHFNGTTLNSHWLTYNTWRGMNPDHDDWDQARCVDPYKAIWRDANVEVSNGTVKLKVKRENGSSWHCQTCVMNTRYTNYTGATIATSYSRAFNAGKFEARMKMPTFRKAHATFWTWHGGGSNDIGVNEIDVAEAYGVSGSPAWALFKYAPKTNYSLHAWPPPAQQNPYNMVHEEQANPFPNQNWYNQLQGNYFKQYEFHTYTCEWDTALIKIYLDGNLQSEFWKYYQTKTYKKWWNPFTTYSYQVGSGCNPSGTYEVMRGFPYNNQSNSNLRFTAGVDDDYSGHSNNSVVGEVEIDYVKVWQKHPENGWTDLCDPANSSITGPNIICSTATFTATPPSPSGYWLAPSSNLTVISQNNASITVQRNTNSTDYQAWVYYYALDPSCPNTGGYFLKSKAIDAGTANSTIVICNEVHYSGSQQLKFNLYADPDYFGSPVPANYNSPTTFEWDIDYGPGLSLHHHVFGQYASTPFISYSPGSTNTIVWKLTITNACGTVTKTGQRSFYLMKKVVNSGLEEESSRNIYLVANLSDEEAEKEYEEAVERRLARTFIPETGDIGLDSIAVLTKIEQIEMEELEPYILLDSSDIEMFNDFRKANPNALSFQGETVLYPNPANTYVNIMLGEKFNEESAVVIRIYDIVGKLEKTITYEKLSMITVNIAELPQGLHSIEIQQGSHREYQRLFKKN